MLRGSGNEPKKQTDPDKVHYITGTQAKLYVFLFLEICSEPHPSMGPKVALWPWSSRFYCAYVEWRRMLSPHSAAPPAVSSSFPQRPEGKQEDSAAPQLQQQQGMTFR